MQNEDQLAFAICHELAHQYMDHVNKQLFQNAEIATNKARNDSIERILKEEYKTSTKLTNLLIPGLTKRMKYSREKELESEESNNITAYGLGTIGFVRKGYTKNDKVGYELAAYDNTLNELWSFGSDPKSKLLEFSDVMSASEKYVALSVIRKQSMLTKKFDSFFILLDAVTGKKIMEVPMRDKMNSEFSLINLVMDDEKNEVLLLGEYYKPGDEVLKDQSQGVYVQRLDLNGSELAFAKYSWSNEIAKLRKESLTEEKAENDKGKKLLYIHKIVVTATGGIYAVGEEYRKTVSAMGTAATVLSRGKEGVSALQITIGGMVVIQINNKLELVAYKLVEKKKNRILLPSGLGYASAQIITAYVKQMGDFDYQFTSIDRDKSSYTVIYSDLNRKTEGSNEKADVLIGSIAIKGSAMDVKRTPINSDAKRVGYHPAKSGYIMVTEYYPKNKNVELHLEKI